MLKGLSNSPTPRRASGSTTHAFVAKGSAHPHLSVRKDQPNAMLPPHAPFGTRAIEVFWAPHTTVPNPAQRQYSVQQRLTNLELSKE